MLQEAIDMLQESIDDIVHENDLNIERSDDVPATVESETSRDPENVTDTPERLGEPLKIGDRIEVYWPDDEKYCPGVISSYSEENELHEVLYDDEEVEQLNMRKEYWRFIP